MREELHSSVSPVLCFQTAFRCHISSYSHVTLLSRVYGLFLPLPSDSVPYSPILPTSTTCKLHAPSVKPCPHPPLPAKPTGMPTPCSNKTSLFIVVYQNLLDFSWSLWHLAAIKGDFAIFSSPMLKEKCFPPCPLALRGMFSCKVTAPATHMCTGTCKDTSRAPAQPPSAHCPSHSIWVPEPVTGVCPSAHPHLLPVAALVAGSPLISPMCPDSYYLTFPRTAGTGFPVMLDECSYFLHDSVTSGKYLSFWDEIEMYTSSHQPK